MAKYGPIFCESWLDVALATSSAPTFFPAHKTSWGQSLIDGGVWANNAVGIAVVEAIGVLDWKPEDLKVLSLGCIDPLVLTPFNTGWLPLGLKVCDLMMQWQMADSLSTALILTRDSEKEQRVFRINITAPINVYSLDNVGQSSSLAGLGQAEGRKRFAMVNVF